VFCHPRSEITAPSLLLFFPRSVFSSRRSGYQILARQGCFYPLHCLKSFFFHQPRHGPFPRVELPHTSHRKNFCYVLYDAGLTIIFTQNWGFRLFFFFFLRVFPPHRCVFCPPPPPWVLFWYCDRLGWFSRFNSCLFLPGQEVLSSLLSSSRIPIQPTPRGPRSHSVHEKAEKRSLFSLFFRGQDFRTLAQPSP